MDVEATRRLKNFCDDRGLQIATAESVTVGRLQSMLGAVSGSSTFFRGGITAYNINQKVALLGVELSHATRVDCVSPQVAEEMAKAATRLFSAHIGLATTGYAEPPGGRAASSSYAYFAIFDLSADSHRPVRLGKMTQRRPRPHRNATVLRRLRLARTDWLSWHCRESSVGFSRRRNGATHRAPAGWIVSSGRDGSG